MRENRSRPRCQDRSHPIAQPIQTPMPQGINPLEDLDQETAFGPSLYYPEPDSGVN
jgi:hypothetical protein